MIYGGRPGERLEKHWGPHRIEIPICTVSLQAHSSLTILGPVEPKETWDWLRAWDPPGSEWALSRAVSPWWLKPSPEMLPASKHGREYPKVFLIRSARWKGMCSAVHLRRCRGM